MAVEQYAGSFRGKYLGSVRLGDTFTFCFDPRSDLVMGDSGSQWWETDISGVEMISDITNWRFHVINNNRMSVIEEEQTFIETTGSPLYGVNFAAGDEPSAGRATGANLEGIWFGHVDTQLNTDYDVGQYTIKIELKPELRAQLSSDGRIADIASNPDGELTYPWEHLTCGFDVDYPSPEQAHSITNRRMNWLHDNMQWVRHDIENVVFPRLKRILGFEGENLMLDLFTYDNAGNITSMRARIFDNNLNCTNATPDLDQTDLPEPGELWTYTITQDHNLPRNVRTMHKSVVDYNGILNNLEEMQVTDNFKETDVVNAPRNDGVRNDDWPSAQADFPSSLDLGDGAGD